MRFWFLPACYFVLALFSTLTLTSVAPQLASRQLIFFAVGAAVLYASSRVSFSKLMEMRWPLYILGCILLVVPLIFADAQRNTTRWIDVGGYFTIQPSQLGIPLCAFALIYLLTSAKKYTWELIFKFMLFLGIPGVLILIEPDLGTTIVFVLTLLTPLFLSPMSWKKLGLLSIAGVLMTILAWNFVFHDYQKSRLMAFLNPNSESNYNAHQALIAVGSGKIVGRGLGQGIQSHLRFLPERQTDFIFASFAEEYGYIGCLVLIGLYGGAIYFILAVAQRTQSQEEKLYLIITAVMFFLQASVNIHMNLGLMPITGITLPLMSYGGSSIVSIALMLGICQRIATTLPPKSAMHIS